LFVANKDTYTLDHVNPTLGTALKVYDLLAEPEFITYVEGTNSIYVSMTELDRIVRVDLDTDVQTTISTAGVVGSMSAYGDRLYYTVESGIAYRWDVHSIGDADLVSTHGTVQGDLIQLNPVTRELVAARTGSSPASIYRYSFSAIDLLVEEQFSRDLGSNVRDLAISKDGLHLAALAGGGNGAGYTVHDIQASDLTVSNGAWDTGNYPTAGDFSDSGELFAASNNDDLFVFDANAYTVIKEHVTFDSHCGLSYYELNEVLFSEDDQHIFTKLECGFDNQRSVVFFYQKP